MKPALFDVLICRVCREQWIRAKYERKEFLAETLDADRPYTAGGWGSHGVLTLYSYSKMANAGGGIFIGGGRGGGGGGAWEGIHGISALPGFRVSY